MLCAVGNILSSLPSPRALYPDTNAAIRVVDSDHPRITSQSISHASAGPMKSGHGKCISRPQGRRLESENNPNGIEIGCQSIQNECVIKGPYTQQKQLKVKRNIDSTHAAAQRKVSYTGIPNGGEVVNVLQHWKELKRGYAEELFIEDKSGCHRKRRKQPNMGWRCDTGARSKKAEFGGASFTNPEELQVGDLISFRTLQLCERTSLPIVSTENTQVLFCAAYTLNFTSTMHVLTRLFVSSGNCSSPLQKL